NGLPSRASARRLRPRPGRPRRRGNWAGSELLEFTPRMLWAWGCWLRLYCIRSACGIIRRDGSDRRRFQRQRRGEKVRRLLLPLHAFGRAFPWLCGAAEDGIIAALCAGVFHFVMLAFAGANHGDRAFASRTEVLLVDGHNFDVAFFGAQIVK